MTIETKSLNIGAIYPFAQTLGPGRRFVIWVQGCLFDCPECYSPEWRSVKEKRLVPLPALVEHILRTPNLEGLTLSGGEPMLQAAALTKLITAIRKKRPLSLICYTGFTLKQLRHQGCPNRTALLDQIDVLIDGRYAPSLNDNQGLRGSTNQAIHFLTGIYADRKAEFISGRRAIQIHVDEEGLLAVGVPPQGFAKDLKRILKFVQ